jgi:hypothetical protein
VEETNAKDRIRNPGGTKGGLGEFLLGLALLVAGGYLFTSNVIVTSGFWSIFGMSGFGLTLIPVFIGIAFLFFDSKSVVGWILTGAGVVIIFVGVLSQLHVIFKPESLFNTLLMIGLMAAGLGLVIRSFRTHGSDERS